MVDFNLDLSGKLQPGVSNNVLVMPFTFFFIKHKLMHCLYHFLHV